METAIKKECKNCGNVYCRWLPDLEAYEIWRKCRKSKYEDGWQPLIINEHIEKAKHCIGLDNDSPYKRNGKLFYDPYRNYYCTEIDDVIWTSLTFYGYAKHGTSKLVGRTEYCNYKLTRKGLDWLGETLGIKIYGEE